MRKEISIVEKTLYKHRYINDIAYVPDGVEEIHLTAYAYNFHLAEIYFSSGVRKIDKEAFKGCISLHKVHLNEGLESISDQAFSNTSIVQIELPKSLKHIDKNVFDDCHHLLEIINKSDIPNIDIYKAVGKNRNDNLVIISDYSESNIKNIDNTLYIYKDKYLIYAYSNAFIDSLYIPEGVEEIWGYSFIESSKFNRIICPSTLRAIRKYAFSRCGFKELIFNDGLLEIEPFGLYSNSKCEYIYIPSSVSKCDNSIFGYLYNLKIIEVDKDNPIYTSIDGVLYSKDMTTLLRFPPQKECKEYIIPKNITSIYFLAFHNCHDMVVRYSGTTKEFDKLVSKDTRNKYFGDISIIKCSDGDIEVY